MKTFLATLCLLMCLGGNMMAQKPEKPPLRQVNNLIEYYRYLPEFLDGTHHYNWSKPAYFLGMGIAYRRHVWGNHFAMLSLHHSFSFDHGNSYDPAKLGDNVYSMSRNMGFADLSWHYRFWQSHRITTYAFTGLSFRGGIETPFYSPMDDVVESHELRDFGAIAGARAEYRFLSFALVSFALDYRYYFLFSALGHPNQIPKDFKRSIWSCSFAIR
ncbi:MAG: hypothetical protein H6581_24800 [Bacteroidia bacterium]|nr:hypothetical protein [Bacteroidia bacterium]